MLDPNNRIVLRFRVEYVGKEWTQIHFDGGISLKKEDKVLEIQNDGRIYIYDDHNIYLHIGPSSICYVTQATPWFTPNTGHTSLREKKEEKDAEVS